MIKNYLAGAIVAARRFLKFSAADTVIQATAQTDKICGVSTEVAAASGGRCDVILNGLCEIELGDTVTRGGFVTSDAVGRAVPFVGLVPGANSTALIAAITLDSANPGIVGGQALESGVVGDIIKINCNIHIG